MVYTLTLNPALDYHLFFDDFEQGRLNVPSRVSMHAGGKGLNVARVLNSFGVPCECLGYVGGFSGDFICNDLNESKILNRFIRVAGNTRVNLKMNNAGLETEISGISPVITEGQWVSLMDQIVLTLKEGDVLVLSGSIPDSLSMNAYADIIASCPDGVKIFLDTRGNGLKVSLSKSVYAVKPNWKEMEEWAGEKLFSFEDLLSVAKRMIECGVKYVLFSMGKEGAAIVSKDNTFRAYAPEGQLISSVGSGDAMLAGYIFAEEKELPLSECLSYAVASGSSTAFSEGLCAAKGVQQMLKTGIRIESYY